MLARRAGRHELIDRSAALTYYTVLALAPGFLVLFALIGLLGNAETIDEVLTILRDIGPDRTEAAARDPLESLVTDDARSSALLGFGVIGVLWTASAYIGSFFRASATIWGLEREPLWRAWPLRMALTAALLTLLALALLLITLTGQLAQSVGNALGIGQGLVDIYGFLKWPVLLMLLTLLIGLLYRASPSGQRSTRWRVLTPGGAAATIAALVWLWLTNLTLLTGVELDAALEYGRNVASDSPP